MEKQRKFTKPKGMSFRWVKENIHIAIMMVIAFIVSASVFVGWFTSVDWKKATDEDWNQLYRQAEAIQKQELEATDNNARVSMKITLESDECMLILKKGEDNKFSEIIESDKAVSLYEAVGGLLFMVVMCVLFWYVVLILEAIVYSIIVTFFECKLKQKRET